MDRSFQLEIIRQKIEYAKSTDANLVCNSINDIFAVLKILGVKDVSLINPLETAYEIADVSLGLGEEQLIGMYANQVLNLLEEFSDKAKVME